MHQGRGALVSPVGYLQPGEGIGPSSHGKKLGQQEKDPDPGQAGQRGAGRMGQDDFSPGPTSLPSLQNPK